MSVVVIGDVVTDVVVVHSGQPAVGSDTDARITITGGGAAANTAAWLADLGTAVTLVGVVGADAAGSTLVAELRAVGVRCRVRMVDDVKTGTIVVLSADGERTMLVDRGANGLLTPDDVVVGGAGHVHVSGYPFFDPATRPAARAALSAAAATGQSTSVDVASAAPLCRVGPDLVGAWAGGADLVFANEAEATAFGCTGAAELARRLGTTVVLKRGANGATWAGADGTEVTVPGRPATVVDPTGAGDAFAAGTLAAWLEGAEPEECLRRGCVQGARAVTRTGARPA